MKNNFPKNLFIEHVQNKNEDFFLAYDGTKEIGEIGEKTVVGMYELKELVVVKTDLVQDIKPFKEGK